MTRNLRVVPVPVCVEFLLQKKKHTMRPGREREDSEMIERGDYGLLLVFYIHTKKNILYEVIYPLRM